MGEIQIFVKIGGRPPEIFTEKEIGMLVGFAEEWLGFCQKQERTKEEKDQGRNPCNRCPLKAIMFDLDPCGIFQDFFRMRKEKLEERKQLLTTDVSNFKAGIESISNLIDFIDGKREAP